MPSIRVEPLSAALAQIALTWIDVPSVWPHEAIDHVLKIAKDEISFLLLPGPAMTITASFAEPNAPSPFDEIHRGR